MSTKLISELRNTIIEKEHEVEVLYDKLHCLEYPNAVKIINGEDEPIICDNQEDVLNELVAFIIVSKWKLTEVRIENIAKYVSVIDGKSVYEFIQNIKKELSKTRIEEFSAFCNNSIMVNVMTKALESV